METTKPLATSQSAGPADSAAPQGVDDRVPATPTGAGGDTGGDPGQQSVDWKKVDWSTVDPSVIPSDVINQHKDFRQLKSAADRRLDELRRQYESQLTAVKSVNSRVTELANERVPEVAQEVRMFQMQTELEQARNMLSEWQSWADKAQRATQLSVEHGIPLEELQDADDMDAVVEKHQQRVFLDMRQELEELKRKISARQTEDSISGDTAISSGVEQTTLQSQIQKEFVDAMKSKNSMAASKAIRRARENNITLDTSPMTWMS